MLLTGKPDQCPAALAVGLVNRVVPADQLDASIRELTDAILASSVAIVGLGKRAFYDQLALDEPAAYERATCLITENVLQHDAQEGIAAFLQKRNPHWKSD